MSSDPEPIFSEEEIENLISDIIGSERQDLDDDGAYEEALQELLHTWYPTSSEDNNSVIDPNSASFPVKQDGEENVVNPKSKDDAFVKKESEGQ